MIKVAILGFGTVGKGVADVLGQNAGTIAAHAGQDIELKYILDIVDFPDSPWGDRVVHDFSVIEQDPEVQIVVETIGGLRFAYDYTRRALTAGKSVVTSNKELVAERGAELLQLAREHNVNYFFEASVGGGIPIIRPLTQCLAANEIREITGILNGTTNYILTRMHRDGMDMDTALREAQANGYAEADPSADIDGPDACRKICILADLAFGHHISPKEVYTEGIRNITAHDMACAEQSGYVIKLLGRVIRRPDGRVHILVAPHLVPAGRILASVNGVFNGIYVLGDMAGELMFYGRGAGKLPTASAVAADVMDAAGHLERRKAFGWTEEVPGFLADVGEMVCRHYVRLSGCPAEAVREQFPGARIIDDTPGEIIFFTEALASAQAGEKLQKLEDQGAERKAMLRILD